MRQILACLILILTINTARAETVPFINMGFDTNFSPALSSGNPPLPFISFQDFGDDTFYASGETFFAGPLPFADSILMSSGGAFPGRTNAFAITNSKADTILRPGETLFVHLEINPHSDKSLEWFFPFVGKDTHGASANPDTSPAISTGAGSDADASLDTGLVAQLNGSNIFFSVRENGTLTGVLNGAMGVSSGHENMQSIEVIVARHTAVNYKMSVHIVRMDNPDKVTSANLGPSANFTMPELYYPYMGWWSDQPSVGVPTSSTASWSMGEIRMNIFSNDSAPAGPGFSPPSVDTFTAVPSTISVDTANVTLSWGTTDGETVAINNGVGDTLDVDGGSVVSPDTTTVYTITVTNADGSDSTQDTVTFVPAPTIASFTANPASINLGETSALIWVVNNGDSVHIDILAGSFNTSDTTVDTPTVTTTYVLTAFGSGGNSADTLTITVTVPPPPSSPPSDTGNVKARKSSYRTNFSRKMRMGSI